MKRLDFDETNEEQIAYQRRHWPVSKYIMGCYMLDSRVICWILDVWKIE